MNKHGKYVFSMSKLLLAKLKEKENEILTEE